MILNIEGDNSGPIHIGANVHAFAGKAYEDIKSLSSMVDNENIKKIGAFDINRDQEIIELGLKEKEIFKAESRLEEQPIKITGRIFRIDIRAKSGKMLVTDSSDPNLFNGEFSFEIMLDEDIERCCSAINRNVEFIVLKRIQYDPIKLKDQVKSLRIIRVG